MLIWQPVPKSSAVRGYNVIQTNPPLPKNAKVNVIAIKS
jgi:hypothetical protein